MVEISLLVVFPALMAYAAASDLLTMTIPNKLSIALVVAFAAYALVGGLPWPVLAMHAGAGATAALPSRRSGSATSPGRTRCSARRPSAQVAR